MAGAIAINEARAIVLRETMISTLPNAAVSAGFVWLLFRDQTAIPLWGMNGLAFDLVPTTFMLTLMTTIALTLIFRKRRRDGALPAARFAPAPASAPAPLPLPRNPVLRGLVLGSVLLALFVPVSIFALGIVWQGDWPFGDVLVFKIIYGVLVGWVATPLVVLAVLREA